VDPLEWTNLANQPEHASIKATLAQWLPKENVADQGGGKAQRKAEKKDRNKQARRES
jgi:hypothetical protein